MTVAGKLEDLRAALPGCSLVAFGDLSSRLTLCVSASEKRPQEQLDALCVTAGRFLDGPMARRSTALLGGGKHIVLNEVAVLTTSDLQLYLRSENDDADVLCCVCSNTTNIQKAAKQARSTLLEISATP